MNITKTTLFACFLTIAAFSAVSAQTSSIRHIGGSKFIYIVKADGTVSGFGNEESYGAFRTDGNGAAAPQAISFPNKVRQIVGGYDMQFALLEDGTVLAWGMNDRGQFGRGPGSSRTPENPLRSANPVSVPLPKDIVQIAAGGHYGMAVRSNGALLAWGEHPASETLSDVGLRQIELPAVAAISAGGHHALALAKDGSVLAWGDNKNGQLGVEPTDQMRRSRKPLKIAGLSNVVSVAAEGTTNFGFSGAVTSDGSVWMWGSNQSATLGKAQFWGNGGPADSVVAAPTKVAGITTAKAISFGTGHVGVLLKDATVRLWGHDGWGQIGVGTSGSYQPVPKKPAIANVAAIYLVSNRTFIVKADGTVWWCGPAPTIVRGGPFSQDKKVPTQFTGF